MTIGSKLKFTFKNQFGTLKQEILILSDKSYDMVDEEKISDIEVYEKLCANLKEYSLDYLREKGYILAARNLLKKYDDATDIIIQPVEPKRQQNQSGDAGAGILVLVTLFLMVLNRRAIIKYQKNIENQQ